MSKQLAKTANNQKLTPQQQKLLACLFTEPNIKDAARKAGYTESSVSSTVYGTIKKPKFQQAILQYATENNLLNIPVIAQIEGKILKEVLKKPAKYKNYKEVFKQTKQIAGLLSAEERPQSTVINIKSIGKVQVALSDIAAKRLGG
jgi:phage terminase small subunit